jgi:hypothetical protein
MSLHRDQVHPEYIEGCFGCKISTLQLNPGDAAGSMVASGWTNKKWNNELKAYRDARAQGIQPDGTSMSKIRKAVEASNKAGVAYGS